MEQLQYKLDRFEGPLDLLLNLVEKNKINIDDIPISLLCAQYMEYITAAQKMDVELSSEFIVMASELMLIKSKMLLPRNEETEEDPRAALAAAMLEYQRIKQTTTALSRMFTQFGMRMIKDTDEIKSDTTYVADHSVELLSRAMLRVMNETKLSDTEIRERFEPLVRTKTVSVAAVANELMDLLKANDHVSLHTYFMTANTKPVLITMFMAMLELLKSAVILLDETIYTEDGVIYADDSVSIRINPEMDQNTLDTILKESANY